ncbi:hypothetical protein GOV04_04460 [Candidatus Woesearchaeota archaeon]|nr:hypothetical protein [Candidatus Woesearchaeota archaeon]
MSDHSILLQKKLSREPIIVPGNPFWTVFKRFGRDETIALIINTIGTALVAIFLSNIWFKVFAGPISRRTRDIVLSTTGPVVEKAGFFPAHFKEALSVYRNTPKQKRDPLTTYFRRAMRGGAKSLTQDILVHDPIYIILMFFGLRIYPVTPAWILALTSFVIAVLVVAGLEVTITEMAFKKYKRALKKSGFGIENYYESRFFISSTQKLDQVLSRMAKKFSLENTKTIKYYDRYFDNNLPVYNSRTPKIRLRKRLKDNGKGWLQSAQLIYTRAAEMSKKELEQHRYFPIKKEKTYFPLNQKMPKGFADIKNVKAKRIFIRSQKGKSFDDVYFERVVVYDAQTLWVSADKVFHQKNDGKKKRPFFVLELKVHNDIKLLKEAMRFVMREFPVVQTTHSKHDLVCVE